MINILDLLREQKLQWLPELGIGYFPVVDQPYDKDYWLNYRHLDETPTGAKLTEGRVALANEFWPGALVDVGIGGGVFLQQRPFTSGFDINPHAVDWLKQQCAWLDPTMQQVDAVSFWDSLEHIHEPGIILDNVRRYVFVSTPIYRDIQHVLRSKHYKPSEHCWYFTILGLTHFMHRFGFQLMYYDDREQDAGREDIFSFVFERV